MAEVITKFKLETTQYDSKLRDAAKALSDFSRQAALAGDEFDKFASKGVEQARAFGSISTNATNAKDKVKELVEAYNSAAKAYNALNDEQKKGEFGKAWAESMQQLKTRIQEAKVEMNSTPGVFDQLASKFTLNVDVVKLFNLGLQGAKQALDVVKDAFFASEQNIDLWGQTVESSKMLYEGFLTSLNTGDISGYLTNINNIVKAATDAYNAIDLLNTTQQIQAPELLTKQSEITRLQTMLRTNRYIAPLDSKQPEAGYVEGQVLSTEQSKAIAEQLKTLMADVGSIYERQVNASTAAVDALYQEQAEVLGMSNEEFRKGVSSIDVFMENLRKAGEYRKWEAEHSSIVNIPTSVGTLSRPVRDNSVNPYESYKAWGVFKDDGELYNRIVGMIQKRAGLESSYYGMIGQSYRGINKAEGSNSGGTSEKKSKQPEEIVPFNFPELYGRERQAKKMLEEMEMLGDFADLDKLQFTRDYTNSILSGDQIAGNTDLYQKMNRDLLQSVKELNANPVNIAPPEVLAPLQQMEAYVDSIREKMKQAASPEEYARLSQALEGMQQNIDEFTGKSNPGDKMAEGFSKAAQSIGMIGSALSSLEDPAAKVAGIIAEAIANIALSFSQSLKGTVTPWDWIAGAIGGTATMISTISAIKSATAGSYAIGGVIPGSSYSGDNQIAMVNAGETILTRAQTNQLASQLGSRSAEGQSRPYVTGESIYLGLNNYLKSTGRGSLITSRG